MRLLQLLSSPRFLHQNRHSSSSIKPQFFLSKQCLAVFNKKQRSAKKQCAKLKNVFFKVTICSCRPLLFIPSTARTCTKRKSYTRSCRGCCLLQHQHKDRTPTAQHSRAASEMPIRRVPDRLGSAYLSPFALQPTAFAPSSRLHDTQSPTNATTVTNYPPWLQE